MQWYVYYFNFNANKIEKYNVLNSHVEEYIKKLKKKVKTKEEFAEELRRELMYRYWSKCEWEIVINGWPSRDGKEAEKIDVYDQIMMNWEQFVDYCWNFHHKYQRNAKKE